MTGKHTCQVKDFVLCSCCLFIVDFTIFTLYYSAVVSVRYLSILIHMKTHGWSEFATLKLSVTATGCHALQLKERWCCLPTATLTSWTGNEATRKHQSRDPLWSRPSKIKQIKPISGYQCLFVFPTIADIKLVSFFYWNHLKLYRLYILWLKSKTWWTKKKKTCSSFRLSFFEWK